MLAPTPRIAVAALLALGLLAPPSAAHAKADPIAKCTATKRKVTGKAVAASLACEAAAAKKGITVDPICRTDAIAALTAAFAKAEAAARKADALCSTEGDAAAAATAVGSFVDAVVAAVRVAPEASKCTTKKLVTVGQFTARLFLAHAKNAAKPDPAALDGAVLKADEALAKAFGKLDEKGKDCRTSGDGSALRTSALGLVVGAICDDGQVCTDESFGEQQACLHVARTCAEHLGCDTRTGACVVADCCLMGKGPSACVVPIPADQLPTSAAFCAGIDGMHADLSLLSFGPSCIGWRAVGFVDCL